MALAAAGAILGAINFGTAASAIFLFGSSVWVSIFAGALIGFSLSVDFNTGSTSPTYSFGAIQNTKTQKLPVPLVYGICRVAGNVFYDKSHNAACTTVDRYIGISMGPVLSITEIKANDKLIRSFDDCSIDIHYNTDDTTTDSRDPATGPRPYPNGLAFIALTLKAQENLSGSSVITSIVHGRVVWCGTYYGFTRNPVWIARDILTNKVFGMGIAASQIDDVSFAAAAAYCDELVDGEPRFTCDYCIDTQKDAIEHLQCILDTCRAFLHTREKVRFLIDRPVTTYYKKIGPRQIVKDSFSWWQSADDEIYNRVIIEWIDPDNSYEQTVTIFEDTSDINERGIVEQSFSLLGITRAAQAARAGAYLIDASKGVRNYCSFKLSLKDADVDVFDVVAITNDLAGWVDKWFRVLIVTDEDSHDNSITVTCAEYVPEMYDDVAMNIVAHIDTNLDSPFVAPDVTSFAAYVVNGDTNFAWLPAIASFNNVTGYEIRKGNSWENGELVVVAQGRTTEKVIVPGLVSRRAVKFWLSAIARGQYSANPISCELSTPNVSEWDIVQQYDHYQDATLSGEISVAFDNTLWIQRSGVTLSDIEDEVLSTFTDTKILQPAAGEAVITGAVVDLGKVTTGAISIDYEWQNAPGKAVTIMRRTSLDNVVWSDWAVSLGSMTGRYLQIKLIFASVAKAAALKDAILYVDVPEQTLRFHGVVIDTTAGVTLTFEPAYVSKPAVVTQINDVNLTSIVSDVNESSVHVRLETVDGVAATGTVEVIAHGF